MYVCMKIACSVHAYIHTHTFTHAQSKLFHIKSPYIHTYTHTHTVNCSTSTPSAARRTPKYVPTSRAPMTPTELRALMYACSSTISHGKTGLVWAGTAPRYVHFCSVCICACFMYVCIYVCMQQHDYVWKDRACVGGDCPKVCTFL